MRPEDDKEKTNEGGETITMVVQPYNRGRRTRRGPAVAFAAAKDLLAVWRIAASK